MNAINQAEVTRLFDAKLVRHGASQIVRVAPDGARCVILLQVATSTAPEKAEWLTKTDTNGCRFVAESSGSSAPKVAKPRKKVRR